MSFVRSLPQELQAEIGALIARDSGAQGVLEKLHGYLTGAGDGVEGARKKRRVEAGAVVLPGISTSAPERRKMAWMLSATAISLAKDAAGGEADHTFSAGDITTCLCLPVPDRAKPQYNLIVYTRHSGADPALQATLGDGPVGGAAPDAAGTPLYEYVVGYLRDTMGLEVEMSRGPAFAAYRGSKEGHLFLLREHVFFGFKKPVLLLRLDDIESISYSSITRLTFNTTVKLTAARGGAEYEFSMIDHAEYDAIDGYVVANELSNASMSEARRAKQVTKEYSNELAKAGEEAAAPAPSAAPNAAQGAAQTDTAALIGAGDGESEEDEDYATGSGDSTSGSDSDDSDSDDSDSGEEE